MVFLWAKEDFGSASIFILFFSVFDGLWRPDTPVNQLFQQVHQDDR